MKSSPQRRFHLFQINTVFFPFTPDMPGSQLLCFPIILGILHPLYFSFYWGFLRIWKCRAEMGLISCVLPHPDFKQLGSISSQENRKERGIYTLFFGTVALFCIAPMASFYSKIVCLESSHESPPLHEVLLLVNDSPCLYCKDIYCKGILTKSKRWLIDMSLMN